MIDSVESKGGFFARSFKVATVLSVRLLKATLVPRMLEIMSLLRIWRPVVPLHDTQVKRFAEINKQYWASSAEDGPGILVEGHLSEYGPNYLFRTGVAAKAVQSELGGGDIVVVVNGFSYQWQSAIKAYASFGMTRWVFLGRKFMLSDPFIFIFASAMSALQFYRLRTPLQLLNIHLGGIKIGDLIYDEVLRSTGQPTVQNIDWSVYKVMARSWFYYYQYHLVFRMRSYSYYIATHTAYPQYGLLCRVALQRGIKVIETSDIQMSSYHSISESQLPTYHQGVNAEILKDLESGNQSVAEREAVAREGLRRRLDSEIKQIDAEKAYLGKIYTPDELRAALNIPANHRIGFVMTHIFKDSPHLSSCMLHADYYRWLESTIDCCAGSPGISWVVKPHPSYVLYGEEGMVEALVVSSGAKNIHMCPKDLNTSSLSTCADVLLTVHGTAGLEYACLGIPTILAGTPFYSGFGFTQEPQTVEEYAIAVRNAASLPRLTEYQVSTALQVYETWERQFDWNNGICTPEVLARVWGNGVERDLVLAYNLITKNLEANNPKEMKLWHFAREVVSRDRVGG